MQDFRKLIVWQKSHALALSIYKATAPFPDLERYGLTSQMRRAAYSIPANIAEGCGRAGRVELRQFLHLSLGSASELDYFLLLARDLQFLIPRQYDALERSAREVKLMLAGLIAKISLDSPRRGEFKRASVSQQRHSLQSDKLRT
jgi:four helix bundle protein